MVAPVANTITSTTSATQDLEVFKNYPSEKNNKLIQKKYGSEDEFFKKVQEEGYKEGFESVPKPSFDPNLPINEIGEGTYQKYMGQFLPPETTGGAASSGIIPQEPTQTWNQKLNVPNLLASGEASQALYNQGALPDVKMTADTPVDMPSNVPKGDVRQFIESIEQKILTEDDSWSILKMLKNLRSMKKQAEGGITTAKEAVEPTAEELKNEALQIEGKYQTSLVEKIIPTLSEWGKNIKDVTGKVIEGIKESDLDQSERVKKLGVNYKEKIASHNKRLAAVGMKSVVVPLVFSTGGKHRHEPLDWRTKELLRRERLMMEAGKAGADPEFELDKYIAKQKEKKVQEKKEFWETDEKETKDVTQKDTKDVIQEVTEEKIAPQADVRRDLEKDKINALMEDAETGEGLGDAERGDLIKNLKGEGVKTKGLTDKNMLLIAMGLGMMASDKPGLQGAGAGALEGLKVVAPLMKEKSSDIQMITVKDKDGKNIVVRYNKKKGTYEKTGLTSATTGTQTKAQQLEEIGAMANIPKDVMATAYYENMKYGKGKSRDDKILYTMSIIKGLIPEMTKDAEGLKDAATKIVDGMGMGLSLDELAKSLGL